MHSQDNPRDRRRFPRAAPTASITASTVVPPLPLTDVEVIDVSAGGIALRTHVPLAVGQRLSFSVTANGPTGNGSRLRFGQPAPILAEVLAVDPIDGGLFHVRCRALLGAFEAA